ncbi:ornithine cyclodeaminase family protein [Microlunatus sp. GCM10028923]|uniref:ornithine cyclodeaminase family protein n=1 Tax=Microlunatus sp. GCM10028923 TaxID=3273400 RepID=UPI0036243152
MKPVLIDDGLIKERLTPDRAVAWIRDALRDHADGRLVAPPRATADLAGHRLMITAGLRREDWYGYRSYLAPGSGDDDQVVVVQDLATGRVRGIATGTELGPRRTGAIGGVAADLLARTDATTLALIGTGRQARAQLDAIRTVRALSEVRCFSPTERHRRAFADRAQTEFGVLCVATGDARSAVEGADLVVLATDSPVPVIDPAWLAPGCFVSTLGPKQVGRAEFGPDLVDAVQLAATDSTDQLAGYQPPNILAGTPQADRVVALGDLLTGRAVGRTTPDQKTLFLSVGLAGTEAYLLARML